MKIIDLDLQRRRISLSIKQAAEGGCGGQEYQEHFGEHRYDDEGNYIGPTLEHSEEAEAAWAEYSKTRTRRPKHPLTPRLRARGSRQQPRREVSPEDSGGSGHERNLIIVSIRAGSPKFRPQGRAKVRRPCGRSNPEKRWV